MVLIPEYKKHLEKPTSPPLDLVPHPAAASSSPTDGEAPPKPKKLKKELTEEERSRRKREAGIKFKEEMAQLAEVRVVLCHWRGVRRGMCCVAGSRARES